VSAAVPVCAAPASTRPARHPARAVSTALITAITLACSNAALAQQDPRVREVLEAQRRGLEEGGDKLREGVRKLENRDAQGMEGLAESMVDVAEGFCMAVNANADAFAELGIDFSDMVASAAGGESAAKYSEAKDVCGQMQAEAESFALTGCTDIVVGSRTTLTVSAARGGGRYRFSDSKPGVLSIAAHGSSATVTATAPGIVTVKAERTDKAKGPSAEEVMYSLEVKSINGGNPVQMGLYDAKGRSIDHHDVPVEVVPRGAARRVIYRPASGLLTAVGDADSTLTLRASAPVRTTVQAMTTCGQTTGPALEVEVVPCTDEVKAELRAERDRLHQRRDRILAAISEVLNDPEVERAMREFEGHANDLAKKAAELIVTAAGRVPGTSGLAKAGQETMKTLADVDSVAEHLVKMSDAANNGEIGGQQWNETTLKAYGDAVANTIDLIAKKALVGPLKTAIEAGMAAQDVGQDIGTSMGAADRLKELDAQLDAVIKELEDVWRRLELCKDKRTPPEDSSRPDSPPEGEPPVNSRTERPPEEGRPPQRAKEVEIGDNDAPVDVDEPGDTDTPVKPPGSPAGAATMAGLMFEEQCPGWEPVAAKQTGVFATLGNNVGALGQFFGTQKAQVLDPLAKQLEGTQQALQLFVEAKDLPAEQQLAQLKRVNALLGQHRPEKLAGFAPGLAALSIQSQACSGLLRNSFELKIEELRARF